MGLSGYEILDILELIFFTPAFVLSCYVVYKHGHKKQLGWRFLVLICLFRLIGSICSLISVHHPATGLTVTYDVMNSFGLSAVIFCALGLLDRVQTGMDPHGLPRRLFRLLHLPGLAGLILSILASINVFSDNPSDVSTGWKELKAAICLFLSVYVADVLIDAHCWFKVSHVQAVERRLLFAVTATLPFIAVRVVYSMLCVFAGDFKWFSAWSLAWRAVLVHGIMGVLMEAITVCIFLWAGFTTVAQPKAPVVEAGKVNYDLGGRSV